MFYLLFKLEYIIYVKKYFGGDFMGYSLKSLKLELEAKNLADYGLIAWGQSTSAVAAGALFGAIGGAIASATSRKYAITMIRGSQIAVFPFTSKEIKYNEAIAFDKSQLAKAKISGLIGKKLVLETYDGKKHSYSIMQGAKDLKTILSNLGFN